MDGFPTRLREQRKKLDLTQADFAEKCGVKRRAQAAYEAGERVPDANYLIGAARLGADLKYLLSGVLSTDAEREKFAVDWLVRTLCQFLEIPADLADTALALATNINARPPDEFGKQFEMEGIASELLRGSRRLNSVEVQAQLNRDLLVDAIREQEEAWARRGKQPSPIERSHRFATIYQDAAASGRLNRNLIEGGGAVPLPARRTDAA